MSVTTAKLVTADELLVMPKDGFHYELVKGELKRMPPTGEEHGRLTMELAARRNLRSLKTSDDRLPRSKHE